MHSLSHLWTQLDSNLIMVRGGGRLELHGRPVSPPWARLTASAAAGDATVTIGGSADWRAGDTIVIAPSAADPLQSERRVLTSAVQLGTGASAVTQLGLDAPLAYTHWGVVQPQDGFDVNLRAEVALLGRSITVRGPRDGGAAERELRGGHLQVTAPAHLAGRPIIKLDSVQLSQVGVNRDADERGACAGGSE